MVEMKCYTNIKEVFPAFSLNGNMLDMETKQEVGHWFEVKGGTYARHPYDNIRSGGFYAAQDMESSTLENKTCFKTIADFFVNLGEKYDHPCIVMLYFLALSKSTFIGGLQCYEMCDFLDEMGRRLRRGDFEWEEKIMGVYFTLCDVFDVGHVNGCVWIKAEND